MREESTFELSGVLHAETDRSILVSDDGDEKNAKWLSLSIVTFERGTRIDTSNKTWAWKTLWSCEVEMPEWLAKEKGFI